MDVDITWLPTPESIWLPPTPTSMASNATVSAVVTNQQESPKTEIASLDDALQKDENSWNRFLEKHELEGLWNAPEATEKQKYANVIDSLQGLDSEHRLKEEQLVQCKVQWMERQRGRCRVLPMYKSMIRDIEEAAVLVEMKWKDQKLIQLNVPDTLSRSQPLQRQDQRRWRAVTLQSKDHADGFFTVKVVRYLRDTRYYLGHAAGDYIFRYKESKCDILGLPKGEVDTSAFSRSPWYTFHADIDVPDDALETLIYAGQVPRPLRQYIGRMLEVFPDVLRILQTILAFGNEGERENFHDVYHEAHDLTFVAIAELVEKWQARYPISESVPDFLIEKVASHPIVLEFIHLFSKCYVVSQCNVLLEGMAPIVQLVECAARKSFWKLTDAAVKHEEDCARALLLEQNDSSHVLIFEDEYEKDIHSFYNSSYYHGDPIHHLHQYNWANSEIVDLALETSGLLLDTDLNRCPHVDSSAPLTQHCDGPGCSNPPKAPVSGNLLSVLRATRTTRAQEA